MQGYIISSRVVKNQDLILRILTSSCVVDVYRFYGVRHSILSVGKKIDFELQQDSIFLPKLRNVIELGYVWEREYARAYVWRFFIDLLASHLQEVSEIEGFYFDLLDEGALQLDRQNPMRIALEMSAKIIKYEGRIAQLHHQRCFVCDAVLEDQISLGRSFLFAHSYCIGGYRFDKSRVLSFLRTCSTIALDDSEIEELWKIFSMGL